MTLRTARQRRWYFANKNMHRSTIRQKAIKRLVWREVASKYNQNRYRVMDSYEIVTGKKVPIYVRRKTRLSTYI